MAEHTFLLPDLGEGLDEATVAEWLVHEGDEVALNQPIAEIETAKATIEIPSPYAGTIMEIHVGAGQTVRVGEALVSYRVGAPSEGSLREPSAGASSPLRGHVQPQRRGDLQRGSSGGASARGGAGHVAATPAVRYVARELGVELGSVRGTGVGGRITREDVERAAGAGVGRVAAEDEYVVEAISGVRRAIAEHLTRQVRTVPHVTTWRSFDASALQAYRQGLGVSPLPVVVRALAEVCARHPVLNASYREEPDEIWTFRRVHVGIATDTERGLIVPVVRDVGAKSVTQVAGEIERLAAGARENRLSPEDLAGGTITVTNTGSYGSEAGTPIINGSQAAILALGVIEARALVVGGRVEARPACTLSLSFDHRLLDGATAGRAFGDLVELLESSEHLENLPA